MGDFSVEQRIGHSNRSKPKEIHASPDNYRLAPWTPLRHPFHTVSSICLLLPLLALQGVGEADAPEIYANGRLRWESTYNQPDGTDRHRARMRARLGARYAFQDDFRIEGRLSTASDGNDANTPYWDFGDGSDGFNGADITLDRYFLTWYGDYDLEVHAGKQPHIFDGPTIIEVFLWDDDVQPSGLTSVYAGGDEEVQWDVRGAAYVAVEAGSGHDATMVGAQANLHLGSDELDWHLGSSFHGWGGLGGFGGTLDNQGNTDVTGDFQIWDTFLNLSSNTGPMGGWEAFAQYYNNTATGTEDTGFAFGSRLGKGRNRGDANLFLVYYDLDADAVFSPVAQNDTPIAGTGLGTGMRGVFAGVQYYFRDGMGLRLWVINSDTDTADPYRIRLDLDFTIR